MKRKNYSVATPLVVFILLSALLLSGLPLAHAEGVLVTTEPKEVSSPVNSVTLWFSGNITARTPTLIVFDNHGKRVDDGKPKLKIAQRSELSVTTTGTLPAGAYTARYRVLTQDGLVVSGIYKFAIKS